MEAIILWHYYNKLGDKIRSSSATHFEGSLNEFVKRLNEKDDKRAETISVAHQIIILEKD